MDSSARQSAERRFSREDPSHTADLPSAVDFDADTVELDPPTAETPSREPVAVREKPAREKPEVAREQSTPAGEEPTQVSVTVQVHRGAAAPAPSVHVSAPGQAQSPAPTPDVAPAPSARPATAKTAPPLSRPGAAKELAEASRPRETPEPATAPKFAVPAFLEGETIRARYVLEEQIGAGGSSFVFRARDLRRDAMFDSDAYVALKVPRDHLRRRVDIADRLRREFHQTQALAHPNIVRVFDIDCDHDTWFITMELLDGESLSTLLSCLHPQLLPQREALGILRGCGEALAFAHDRGVLHCDFKPGNVFVTRREDVRVLDFGVACINTASKGAEGDRATRVSAATPCYASPEILAGSPPDERDDVFSLACVAYEMLTGEHPFDRRSTVQARDAGMRLQRLPGLDRRQYRALQRALSWSRKFRQVSVREFLVSMGLAEQQPASMGWLKAGAAVAAGALLAAVAYNFYQGSDRVESATPAGIHWAAASPAEIRARQAAEAQRRQGAATSSSAGARSALSAAPIDTQGAGAGPRVPAANQSSTSARAQAGRAPGIAAAGSTRPGPGTAAPGSTATIQSHPIDAAPLAPVAPVAQPAQRGTGAGPSIAPAVPGNRISLEQARIVASEGAVSAVIRIRRLDDLSGRVRIQWRAIPGTAQPGSDYSMDGLGTIDIPEGQDVRVLFIPILNDPLREPGESFDVELFAVAGPGSLQPITRTTVTILDND